MPLQKAKEKRKGCSQGVATRKMAISILLVNNGAHLKAEAWPFLLSIEMAAVLCSAHLFPNCNESLPMIYLSPAAQAQKQQLNQTCDLFVCRFDTRLVTKPCLVLHLINMLVALDCMTLPSKRPPVCIQSFVPLKPSFAALQPPPAGPAAAPTVS
jgi:hypothetical protein